MGVALGGRADCELPGLQVRGCGGKRLEASGHDKQLDGVCAWAPLACVSLLGPCWPQGHCAAASGAIGSQQTAAGRALASGPCPRGGGRTHVSILQFQAAGPFMAENTDVHVTSQTHRTQRGPPPRSRWCVRPVLVFGDCGRAFQALCVGCPARAK